MSNLEKSQKSLLFVYLLRAVLELFTSTFLTSYIVSLTPDNIFGSGIINVAIFYISWYFVYIILNLVCSYFVDRSNRVSFLRIGIIISMILLIAIVLWGKEISKWIVFAGALCGISDGFFFSSYYVIKNELSNKKSVKEYNLSATISENIVKILVPTFLGYIIDSSTFSKIALYIIIIALIQFVLTFFIKSTKEETSRFELNGYFNYLKTDKYAKSMIKYTYLNSFLAGFKTTYKVIIIILTIYTFKTNFSLGIYTSIFSAITIILLIFFKHMENNKNINKYPIYMLIGILPFIGCLVLVFWTNIYTIIMCNFLLTIAVYFSDYIGGFERDSIIKNLDQYKFIAEHQFVVEAYQCLTRILSYVLFIIAGLFANIVAFKILIVLLLLANPIKYYIMYKQSQVRQKLESTQ